MRAEGSLINYSSIPSFEFKKCENISQEDVNFLLVPGNPEGEESRERSILSKENKAPKTLSGPLHSGLTRVLTQ